MKGIFLPIEILKMKGISSTEKMLLSIYKYYTEEGTMKCCSMTNKDICDMLDINERKLQRCKAKLKELGLINTTGGIKVWYVGLISCGDKTVGGDKTDTPVVTKLVVRGDKSVTGGDKTDTHNKEEKRKKEKNKLNKVTEPIKTNFERLLCYLPDNCRKPEMIDLLKYHLTPGYVDVVNQKDFDDINMMIRNLWSGWKE